MTVLGSNGEAPPAGAARLWIRAASFTIIYLRSEDHRILLQMQAGSDIEAGVLEVLQRVSGRVVDAEMSGDLAADFGFDSLKTLEFVAALEDRFDVSIPLNGLPSMKSVAQVVDHMSVLLSGQRKVDSEAQDSDGGSRISGGPE